MIAHYQFSRENYWQSLLFWSNTSCDWAWDLFETSLEIFRMSWQIFQIIYVWSSKSWYFQDKNLVSRLIKKLLGILRLTLATGRTKVHVCINSVVRCFWSRSYTNVVQLPRLLLQDSGNSFIHGRVMYMLHNKGNKGTFFLLLYIGAFLLLI